MATLRLRAAFTAVVVGAIAATAAPAAHAALVDGSAGCTTSVLHTFLGSAQADCTGVASLGQTLPGAFRFAPGAMFSNTAASGLAGSTAASAYGLQADFGLLRVAAEAHTASTFADPALPASPSALGSAAGRFLDRLTVESTALARGTPVRVRVSGTVAADVTTASNGGAAGARVIASLLIGSPDGPLGDVYCTGTGLGSSCDIVWSGGAIPYDYEFEVDVGQAFDLSFSLTAVASASGQASRNTPSVRSDAVAQALNSLYAFVDPVGTGFTLRAESGHDWRSPVVGAVSEPHALSLALTAVVGGLLFAPPRAGRRAKSARRRPAAGPARWAARLVLLLPALVLLAPPPAAWAGVENRVAAGGERVTQIRTSGRAVYANLFDPASQSSGFLSAARDQVANTTALDFAWSTPLPADPRYVVLIAGAGEIPNAALTVGTDGARLAVVTPFETVRCLVDTETGLFDCASGPAQAFDLVWTRRGADLEWRQGVSILRSGPLTVRAQGQVEVRPAQVTGLFGGLPTAGALGELLDSKGTTVERTATFAPSR